MVFSSGLPAERVFLRRIGELHVIVEWVINMQAAGPSRWFPKAFFLQRCSNLRFVPIFDRVADVVDDGFRIAGGVAVPRNEKASALSRRGTEGQARFPAVIGLRHG